MKVVYISSQYTEGDKEENVQRQIDAAHEIMDMGHCPIAPLLTHFMHLSRPRDYEEWMNIDLELVRRSDILLRLDGPSKGADREVKEAFKQNMLVAFNMDQLRYFLNG